MICCLTTQISKRKTFPQKVSRWLSIDAPLSITTLVITVHCFLHIDTVPQASTCYQCTHQNRKVHHWLTHGVHVAESDRRKLQFKTTHEAGSARRWTTVILLEVSSHLVKTYTWNHIGSCDKRFKEYIGLLTGFGLEPHIYVQSIIQFPRW